jgi:hypothetical protein
VTSSFRNASRPRASFFSSSGFAVLLALVPELLPTWLTAIHPFRARPLKQARLAPITVSWNAGSAGGFERFDRR